MSENAHDLIYKVVISSFFMMAFLGGTLIWFLIAYQKKKFKDETFRKDQLLREQQLLIEKQQAIESERARIAAEMHDDLGSGLTTIRYLSDKALLHAGSNEEAVEIRKISAHSNTLVRNMSEIIWAMNSRFDTTESLTGYLRRYASEYLDDLGIPFSFNSPDDQFVHTIGGERRRNIFLVFKETLHNTAKHSNASRVNISIFTQPDYKIQIVEVDSKGFLPSESTEGNGLLNCRKRLDAVDGNIHYEKSDDSMHIFITVPIHTATHE